jgi:hypothetical protein
LIDASAARYASGIRSGGSMWWNSSVRPMRRSAIRRRKVRRAHEPEPAAAAAEELEPAQRHVDALEVDLERADDEHGRRIGGRPRRPRPERRAVQRLADVQHRAVAEPFERSARTSEIVSLRVGSR